MLIISTQHFIARQSNFSDDSTEHYTLAIELRASCACTSVHSNERSLYK